MKHVTCSASTTTASAFNEATIWLPKSAGNIAISFAIRWLYADQLEVNMQKLTRWGNSIGIRIPAHAISVANLRVSDQVYVRLLDNGDIRVRPVKGRQPADQNVGDSVPSDLKEEEEW